MINDDTFWYLYWYIYTYGDVNNFKDEESGTSIYITECIYVPVIMIKISKEIKTMKIKMMDNCVGGLLPQ